MDKMDFTAEYKGKTSHTSITKELIDDLKMIQGFDAEEELLNIIVEELSPAWSDDDSKDGIIKLTLTFKGKHINADMSKQLLEDVRAVHGYNAVGPILNVLYKELIENERNTENSQ